MAGVRPGYYGSPKVGSVFVERRHVCPHGLRRWRSRLALRCFWSLCPLLAMAVQDRTPSTALPCRPKCEGRVGGNAGVTVVNPLFPGHYSDPQIRNFGKKFWIYPTACSVSGETRSRIRFGFDAFSSDDLATWTRHPQIITDADISWMRGECLWAPDVQEKDGRYYLFFSANDPYPVDRKGGDFTPVEEWGIQKNGGIGVAVAERPEGPYRDLLGKPLIREFWNEAQPIDQYVFRYRDEWYMVYGGWGRCNLVKLASDFKSLVPFEDGRLWRDLTQPGYVEGSVMFERRGVWYFMYSSGSWCNGSYNVRYSKGPTPMGPFEYKGQVLGSQEPLANGAGHHSVLKLPGTEDDWIICYHRRPIPNPYNERVTCIDRMYFDEKGDIKPIIMTKEW